MKGCIIQGVSQEMSESFLLIFQLIKHFNSFYKSYIFTESCVHVHLYFANTSATEARIFMKGNTWLPF